MYQSYMDHSKAELSRFAKLSYTIRCREDRSLLSHIDSGWLQDNSYLRHGNDLHIRKRLTDMGAIAVSLVALEVEGTEIVEEYAQEPFKEVEVLEEWYEELRRVDPIGTPLSWIR